MEGCDCGITDRNRSGICTQCWQLKSEEVTSILAAENFWPSLSNKKEVLVSDTVKCDGLEMFFAGEVLEVLYARQQIAERVAEMGAQITRDLCGEKLVMVGVLKGAAMFMSDLARAVNVDTIFDFVAVSSYGRAAVSSGAVKLIKDIDEPIEGKNVLIVEDILDTGLTLAYLCDLLLQKQPKTLRIATMLDKPSRRVENIKPDYIGFSIPNFFVVGYGMDYAGRYRNLPNICLMASDRLETPSEISKPSSQKCVTLS